MSKYEKEQKWRYQGISMPKKLIEKIKEHIKDDWRYGSVSSFFRAAAIEKIEKESKNPVKR